MNLELPQGWGQTRGLVSPIADGAGGGGELVQLLYKSSYGDLLICRAWSGTVEGNANIYVAKPYLLRRTPFDGKTRNGTGYVYASDTARTATAGGSSITEYVIPYYVVNDILYACAFRAVFGAITVNYLDVNADGRAWAQKTW
jgi:hypothetical protein